MENSRICPSCGYNNDLNSTFCTNCGRQLVQNNIQYNVNNKVVVNNQTNSIDNSDGNKLAVLSLILFFAAPVMLVFVYLFLPKEIGNYFSALVGVSPLSGIVVMVIGIAKYPTNKFLKVVACIITGIIIIGVILFVLFVVWCYVTCRYMVESGGCS